MREGGRTKVKRQLTNLLYLKFPMHDRELREEGEGGLSYTNGERRKEDGHGGPFFVLLRSNRKRRGKKKKKGEKEKKRQRSR